MTEGSVILARLPQADGLSKPRPSVLLRQFPGFGDWLLCGISSQLHQFVPNLDDVIQATDADFDGSGLLKPSVIRVSFLTVVPQREVQGHIGFIARERHRRLLENLAAYLLHVGKSG